MNINDVDEKIDIPDTNEGIWKAIFEKQRALAAKYSDIEGMGTLLETTANNVDTMNGQKWIKDFAWRVTEELAEAFEALEKMVNAAGDSVTDFKDNEEMLQYHEHFKEEMLQYHEHFKEELADSLHFLVELTIIAGYDEKIMMAVDVNVPGVKDAWPTVYNLGLMCNCLKNKPWKQTQMLTDRPKFTVYLIATWVSFLGLLSSRIGKPSDIYLYYFKKNKVNQFRQRSKY